MSSQASSAGGGEAKVWQSWWKGKRQGDAEHYRGRFDFSGLVERARELRKKQITAEALFWELVRDRRFLELKFRWQNKPRLSHGNLHRHSLAGGNPVDGNMPREGGQHGCFVRYAECFIAGFPPARE